MSWDVWGTRYMKGSEGSMLGDGFEISEGVGGGRELRLLEGLRERGER